MNPPTSTSLAASAGGRAGAQHAGRGRCHRNSGEPSELTYVKWCQEFIGAGLGECVIRAQTGCASFACLLVVPTSLVGCWQRAGR
jgi:hypothetical protein